MSGPIRHAEGSAGSGCSGRRDERLGCARRAAERSLSLKLHRQRSCLRLLGPDVRGHPPHCRWPGAPSCVFACAGHTATHGSCLRTPCVDALCFCLSARCCEVCRGLPEWRARIILTLARAPAYGHLQWLLCPDLSPTLTLPPAGTASAQKSTLSSALGGRTVPTSCGRRPRLSSYANVVGGGGGAEGAADVIRHLQPAALLAAARCASAALRVSITFFVEASVYFYLNVLLPIGSGALLLRQRICESAVLMQQHQ